MRSERLSRRDTHGRAEALAGAAGGRCRQPDRRCPVAHGRLAHRPQAGGGAAELRQLPALLALLPGLGRPPRRDGVRRLRLRGVRGLRDLRRRLSRRGDRDGGGGRVIELLTGGEAVAHAMRQIDPDVVPVYPITPQTPIIQGFAKFVADGRAHGEVVNVESEHSAMSAAIGSALAGARTMTATSSQGLALMAEVVYIAAAMRAPIVMALGNRALSGPINIHCDHSDSMLIRDSGAIQLFAENAQEAYDLTVMAPRIAEHPDVLLPVIVCQDGFTITHSAEPVFLLEDAAVEGFVGDYRIPYPLLDVTRATSQGPFAMPDYYFELRRQQTQAIVDALGVFAAAACEFEALSGRPYRPLELYEVADADEVLICLGSSAGTAKDAVDDLRTEGRRVGLVRVTAFRPFPRQ